MVFFKERGHSGWWKPFGLALPCGDGGWPLKQHPSTPKSATTHQIRVRTLPNTLRQCSTQGRQAAGLTTATAVHFVRPILDDVGDPGAHYQLVGAARARVTTTTAGDRHESAMKASLDLGTQSSIVRGTSPAATSRRIRNWKRARVTVGLGGADVQGKIAGETILFHRRLWRVPRAVGHATPRT